MKLDIHNSTVSRVVIDLESNSVHFEERLDANDFSRILLPLTPLGDAHLKFSQSGPAGHALQAFLGLAKNAAEGGN